MTDDEHLPEAQAAFERLGDQTMELDTAAARRAMDQRSRRRHRGFGALAVASAAVVALIAFVVLGSDDPDQDIATPVASTTSPSTIPGPPVSADAFLDQLWLLDTITSDGRESGVEGDPATLFLDSDGTFHASTGCRSLVGEYVLEGSWLSSESMGGGSSCPRELRMQDRLMRSAIGDGATVSIDGDQLRLTPADDEHLSYLAIDRSPVIADEKLSITEFRKRPLFEEDPVEVSGHLVNRGGSWALCESASFLPAVGHFCDSPWITVTNYDSVVAAEIGSDGRPDEAALALAEVNPDFAVDDGIVWTPDPVTLTLIAVELEASGWTRAAVPSWPTGVDLSSEERDVVAAFDAIDESDPIDVGPLRPAESGVQLGLGNDLIATRTPDELADPAAWTLEPDSFQGSQGPFSALDLLADQQETTAVGGSHGHCASPPMPIHPDLQGLRQLSIQPTGIDHCREWFTVDLFLDDAGDVVGITLDRYEP